MPSRFEGSEEIQRHLVERAREAGRRLVGFDPFVVRESTDPEAIVEFDLHGEAASGERFRRSCIQAGGRAA